MNNLLRAYFSGSYWRYGFSLRIAAAALLSAFGTLWLLTEILQFFASSTTVEWVKQRWWFFLLAGLAWALWENRPRYKVSCTLKNRDVSIEIRVGDVLAGQSHVVVPCNTSFDTDMSTGLISVVSVQGQFTQLHYSNVAHLDTDIQQQLALPHTPTGQVKQGKQGKQVVYPIGTTLKVRPQGRTAYLCAVAHMGPHGNATATFEDLKTALPELWNYIASTGDHGDIAVPVFGSGLARIPQSQEVLIREILKSFIAACAAQRPCRSLAVVIHPSEYYRLEMSLKDLGDFLMHLCKYTDFVDKGATGGGQPA